jgi:hypothetical protein
MAIVPDFVTHYHLGGRPPFLNLSELSGDRLIAVMSALDDERTRSASARVFGPRYMELRRRTEAKLRDLFIDAGGRPERTSPHYFVLGSSAWFKGLSNAMQEVVLPLSGLPADVSSVTYPDSFTAMSLGTEYGVPVTPRPYHDQVFRLEDLPELVATYGLPADLGTDYEDYQHRPFEKYIEVQVWSDAPLAGILGP